MDGNSQGAADLVRALLRAAERFSETGRSLRQDYFPHVRYEPISDLAGRSVRLGMQVALPGHQLVFEVTLGVLDHGFAVRGELVLDGEGGWLDLPLIETADAGGCAALVDRYTEELTGPARWHVGRLLESCAS